MESIISLVTNKLVTTILLLALALLAKKYRHLLREVLRTISLRTKKPVLVRKVVRSYVLRNFQWIPIKKGAYFLQHPN